jgi:peptidoglycan/xylan/chitin deacetylase (PgdA/CDA1 family)
MMRAVLLCVLSVAWGQAAATDSGPGQAAESAPASEAERWTEAAPLPGSQALLDACWTSGQLAGTEQERRIRTGLAPDRAPPPEWATEAAAGSLPPLPPRLRGSIRSVDPAGPEARLVALTFDLCEQAREQTGYDGRIVDWLRGHGIRATFFAGGKWLRDHPERAMQLMADPLFEVGNHGWTHANQRVVDDRTARDQLVWTQAQYGVLRHALLERPCAAAAGLAEWERVPEWPAVTRFPYGACNGDGLDLAASLGLPTIQWSVVSGDPDKGQTARAIARAVIAGMERQRGAIVVAHANGRGWHTAEALPLIVEALKARGYRFVTVSELLSAGRPVAAESCYELRPGDNLRYDHPKRKTSEPKAQPAAQDHFSECKPASTPCRRSPIISAYTALP